ncbi:MAG: radical SAM protein [Deltaproteobacteria bacterium]|nr:radical SAM protein [Deltaproteobacteria bacterium]
MPAAPKVAFLTAPGPCDLRCVFCVSYFREQVPPVDAEALASLREQIDRAVEEGVTEVVWGAGDHEPGTFAPLPEALAYARSRGIEHQAIVTNGVRISDPALLQALVDAGLDEVRLSLFAWDRASADLFCDGEGVADAKRRLIEQCRRLGLTLMPNVLLMRANYLRLSEIVDLYAEALGPDEPLTLLPNATTQIGLAEAFQPPLSGVYRVACETARKHPGRMFFLANLPECLRRDQPAPPENLRLSLIPGDLPRAPCESCPGGEACAGLPVGYDAIHRDHLDPSLIPHDAPLELERLTEVLREPADDPRRSLAKIFGRPLPEPRYEDDPAKLAADPTSPFFGYPVGVVAECLAAAEHPGLAKPPHLEGGGQTPREIRHPPGCEPRPAPRGLWGLLRRLLVRGRRGA